MKSPPIITYMYWLFDAVSIFPVSLYNCWLSSFSPHIFYCPLLHLSSWIHHLLWLLIKKNIPVKEMQLKSIKRQKENIQDIFFDTLSVFIHKSSGAKTSFLWRLIMEKGLHPFTNREHIRNTSYNFSTLSWLIQWTIPVDFLF